MVFVLVGVFRLFFGKFLVFVFIFFGMKDVICLDLFEDDLIVS